MRAGASHFHRLKYDGDVLMTTDSTDTGTNTQYGSVDEEITMSTITVPKSGTLNFTYESSGNSSPSTGLGSNSTLTILEISI